MSTQTNKPASTKTAGHGDKPKRQGKDLVLVGEDGAQLRLRAREKAVGGPAMAQAIVIKSFEKDGKRINRSIPGATTMHASFEAAKAHNEKVSLEQQKRGWLVRKGGGGGARKDVFTADSIPGPKLTKELLAQLTPKS